MNQAQILQHIESQQCEQIEQIFRRRIGQDLVCYGMPYGKLKKLASQIGRNHPLAMELMNLNIFETKILASMIAHPKQISEAEIHQLMSREENWMVSQVLCTYLFGKVPKIESFAQKWISSDSSYHRRCGFLIMGELARQKRFSDEFFYPVIEQIQLSLQSEENFVKDAMCRVLYYVGKRNEELRQIILEIVNELGEIHIDYGSDTCNPPNIKFHLGKLRFSE